MSKGTKKHYKKFQIDCIENACLSLSMLIAGVTVSLDKYKEYALEVEKIIDNIEGKYIEAKKYDDIKDKLLCRQYEILKLLADQQKDSFSYIYLRELLQKNNYLSSSLSQENSEILSELRDVRNWSFHNPQSLLVAAKEVAEKNIPDELKDITKVIPQLNPVIIQKVDRYEVMMLFSLFTHITERINQFEKLLANMKDDYQEMYDSLDNKIFMTINGELSSKVQYIEQSRIARLNDPISNTSQISMAIQKSKYDGTDEKFNEWIINFGNDEH